MFVFMSDLPPGYPYQSITAPYGSPFHPYHISTSTSENTDRSCSPAVAASLPSAHRHSRLLDEDIKPQKLEPSKTRSFLKREPEEDQYRPDVTPEALVVLHQSHSPDQASRYIDVERQTPKAQPLPLPLHAPSPPTQQEKGLQVREEEQEGGPIKMEVSSYLCQAANVVSPACSEAEPKPEVLNDLDQTHYPSSITAEPDSQDRAQMCVSLEQTTSCVCEQEQPDTSCLKESTCEPPAHGSPLPVVIGPEDPMGGMFALITASEMAQARSTSPSPPTLLLQVENPPVASDLSSAGALEMVALEGMALLSQIGQHEDEPSILDEGKH